MRDNPEIAVVEDYLAVRGRSSGGDVAGVYITEDRMDCIIGEVYEYDERYDANVVRVGTRPPRTKNNPGNKRRHKSIHRGGLTPEEFILRCVTWLGDNSTDLQAVSVGCFGPFVSLSRRPMEPDEQTEYGRLGILQFHELWSEIPVYFHFVEAFKALGLFPDVRVYTDVDAAAYGEYWFLARGEQDVAKYVRDKSVVFIKFSRSVSAGVAFRGKPWQGRLHLMAGAVQPPRYVSAHGSVRYTDKYDGACNIHIGCIEGLIGQDALEARTGKALVNIPRDQSADAFWDMVAYYIAHLCVTTTAMIAPSRIVIGGRVIGENQDLSAAKRLLARVRGYFYRYIEADPHGDFNGMRSPDYPELLDKSNFITLPSRPRMKNGDERWAMPGRHGLLRLAASKVYEGRN